MDLGARRQVSTHAWVLGLDEQSHAAPFLLTFVSSKTRPGRLLVVILPQCR